jgi:mannose-6-phosphate isomerase-like protein (cupin superfamily)
MTETFPANETVLHLLGTGNISVCRTDETFGNDRSRPELTSGQLLSVFRYAATWDYQERHVDGDELALVIDGSIDFLIDNGDGETPVRVDAGHGCVVPCGAWHRVAPREQSTIMFVTPTPARTQHRAVRGGALATAEVTRGRQW